MALASSKNGIQVCRWPLAPLRDESANQISQFGYALAPRLEVLARHGVAPQQRPDHGILPAGVTTYGGAWLPRPADARPAECAQMVGGRAAGSQAARQAGQAGQARQGIQGD